MSDEEKAVVVLVAARLEFVETETMTADLPTHQEERLALTKAQEEEIVAALRASEEDHESGRSMTMEEYKVRMRKAASARRREG